MRTEIAYVLIFILVVAVVLGVHWSYRYSRYKARRDRGHRDRPVTKPFWMP